MPERTAMEPKILIIDDETSVLHALQIFLEQEGYEVESAPSFDRRIHKADAENLPDIIILDVLLEEADGRAIAKELKSNPKTEHIPIILISAHPSADKTGLASGANAFLAKPFDADALLALIQQFTNVKAGQ